VGGLLDGVLRARRIGVLLSRDRRREPHSHGEWARGYTECNHKSMSLARLPERFPSLAKHGQGPLYTGGEFRRLAKAHCLTTSLQLRPFSTFSSLDAVSKDVS
jgi:hypothetical protein